MTSGGDFHGYKLIKLLLKNANTVMLTASIDGFKRNWWSDKHEYHLESCYCTPQRTASCKVMRRNMEGGSELRSLKT